MPGLYVDAVDHEDFKIFDKDQVYGLDDDDEYTLTGSVFTRAYGGDGGDSLEYKGSAFAHLYGGEGIDFVQGGLLGDALYGGEGNDLMVGDPLFDPAGGGDDYMDGGKGDDHLYAAPGADVLLGGPGADGFHFFEVPVKGMGIDRILDFKHAKDVIYLSTDDFADLSPEPAVNTFALLKGGKFFVGNKAKDGGDRIGYNPKNGDLIYDGNGDGKGGKIVFAELDPGLKVTKDDFLLS